MQHYCRVRYAYELPRHVFVPAPKVDAAVVHLTPRAVWSDVSFNAMEHTAKLLFRGRRKMVRCCGRVWTSVDACGCVDFACILFKKGRDFFKGLFQQKNHIYTFLFFFYKKKLLACECARCADACPPNPTPSLPFLFCFLDPVNTHANTEQPNKRYATRSSI